MEYNFIVKFVMIDVLIYVDYVDEVFSCWVVLVDVEELMVGVFDCDEFIFGFIDFYLVVGFWIFVFGLLGVGKIILLYVVGGLLEEESYDFIGWVNMWFGDVNVGLL